MCLVYHDVDKLMAMTDEELSTHVAKCGEWVDDQQKSGRNPICGALQAVSTAATVRVRNGNLSVSDGPYAETREVLGGFAIIEARDLTEAVQLVAKLDCARVNTVEVRPMLDSQCVVSDPLDRRLVGIIDQIQPRTSSQLDY